VSDRVNADGGSVGPLRLALPARPLEESNVAIHDSIGMPLSTTSQCRVGSRSAGTSFPRSAGASLLLSTATASLQRW